MVSVSLYMGCTGAMWAVAASMWEVQALCGLLQCLCGLHHPLNLTSTGEDKDEELRQGIRIKNREKEKDGDKD